MRRSGKTLGSGGEGPFLSGLVRWAALACGVLLSTLQSPPLRAAEDWEDILQLALRAEHSQTRHDGVLQIDVNSVKGLKAMWKVLADRNPARMDWFVREGAFAALLDVREEKAVAELERVVKSSGKEYAKEAILYSIIWKIRKDVIERLGENDDRKIQEVKYQLRKTRGVEYFALVLPSIEKLDPDRRYLSWLQNALADKNARVRRAAISGLLFYPDEKNVPLLLDNLKKYEKKKSKNYREWVLTRHALEVLTGQYYRDNVEDWFRWWDVVKANFSVRKRVEKEADGEGDSGGRTLVVDQGGVRVTVHMKVAGNGYPLLVLPWRGFEADYFRPYFHGVEEFCTAHYVRMPQLDDFQGLQRDTTSNTIRYPTQTLADALAKLMKDTELEKFALLSHGWEAAHLAMVLTRDYRDKVTHLVMINPWSGGDSFRKAVSLIRERGVKGHHKEMVKGADSRILDGEKPIYVASDAAEAGGMRRALFNLHFADPTQPEVGTFRFLYTLPGGAGGLVDNTWQSRQVMKKAAAGLPAMVMGGKVSGWTSETEIDKVAGVLKNPQVVSFKSSADFPFMTETYRFTGALRQFLRPALKKWEKERKPSKKKKKKKKKSRTARS